MWRHRYACVKKCFSNFNFNIFSYSLWNHNILLLCSTPFIIFDVWRTSAKWHELHNSKFIFDIVAVRCALYPCAAQCTKTAAVQPSSLFEKLRRTFLTHNNKPDWRVFGVLYARARVINVCLFVQWAYAYMNLCNLTQQIWPPAYNEQKIRADAASAIFIIIFNAAAATATRVPHTLAALTFQI